MVKNLPANAGDTGLIPGPGVSHSKSWDGLPQRMMSYSRRLERGGVSEHTERRNCETVRRADTGIATTPGPRQLHPDIGRRYCGAVLVEPSRNLPSRHGWKSALQNVRETHPLEGRAGAHPGEGSPQKRSTTTLTLRGAGEAASAPRCCPPRAARREEQARTRKAMPAASRHLPPRTRLSLVPAAEGPLVKGPSAIYTEQPVKVDLEHRERNLTTGINGKYKMLTTFYLQGFPYNNVLSVLTTNV